MDLEEVSYTRKNKEYVIAKILNKPIEDLNKAYLIRKTVCLNEDFVFEYLENKYDVILAYYFELKVPNNLLIPLPKSASEWSQCELDFYSINLIESDEKTMFGSEDIDLSPNVKEFLEFHTDEFLDNYKTLIKTPNFSKFSDFAAAFTKYNQVMTLEARVDDLATQFLVSVCEKDFFVQRQVPHNLRVGCCDKDATSDISLSDMITDIDGVVLVEDKTLKNVTEKLEAQLIAEGLAVAQQRVWKEEWTVYMISIVALKVTFYTAVFPKKLIDNVKEGFTTKNQTFVLKLKKSFNLGYSKNREEMAMIFKRILKDLRKRR